MLVIVLSHFSLYGPWHLTDQKGLRGTFAWLVMQMGHAGVTVFFAVTGYYMVRGGLPLLAPSQGMVADLHLLAHMAGRGIHRNLDRSLADSVINVRA